MTLMAECAKTSRSKQGCAYSQEIQTPIPRPSGNCICYWYYYHFRLGHLECVVMDIQKERELFNKEFGIDDADTFPAFSGGIENSAALKCNWLGWKKERNSSIGKILKL